MSEVGYMIRQMDQVERPESFGGFKWNPMGEWTEAPDWKPIPLCGNGLHGQAPLSGGQVHKWATDPGWSFELLETSLPQLVTLDAHGAVKVQRAKRVSRDDLRAMPTVWHANLTLCCNTAFQLPAELYVTGTCRLSCESDDLRLPVSKLSVNGSMELDRISAPALAACKLFEASRAIHIHNAFGLTALPELRTEALHLSVLRSKNGDVLEPKIICNSITVKSLADVTLSLANMSTQLEDVDIFAVDSIVFPEKMEVEQNFNLLWSERSVRFPKVLRVGGDANFWGSLHEIIAPDILIVGGTLRMDEAMARRLKKSKVKAGKTVVDK